MHFDPVEPLDIAALLDALDAAQTLAAQLQEALDTRVEIEQAKGILAERHGMAIQDTFDPLRQYARSHNRTVRSVAADVVARTLDPVAEAQRR